MFLVINFVALLRGAGIAMAQQDARPSVEAAFTKVEKNQFLRDFYRFGLGTGMSNDSRFPSRTLCMPAAIVDLHKRKRVATLNLLLDTVQLGKGGDALKATAYAVALERGALAAVPYVDYPVERFEQDRDRFIAEVRSLIPKVQDK
jgi:hypothetical protein